MDFDFKDARFNEFGTIDVDYNHPEYGWIPFTASPDDSVSVGREIYAQAVDGEVSPYVPPTVEEVRLSLHALTKRQLRLGLLANGITSAQVLAVIGSIENEIARETAKIEWEDASMFERLHPLITTVGSALSLSDAEIDAMWATSLNL